MRQFSIVRTPYTFFFCLHVFSLSICLIFLPRSHRSLVVLDGVSCLFLFFSAPTASFYPFLPFYLFPHTCPFLGFSRAPVAICVPMFCQFFCTSWCMRIQEPHFAAPANHTPSCPFSQLVLLRPCRSPRSLFLTPQYMSGAKYFSIESNIIPVARGSLS